MNSRRQRTLVLFGTVPPRLFNVLVFDGAVGFLADLRLIWCLEARLCLWDPKGSREPILRRSHGAPFGVFDQISAGTMYGKTSTIHETA